MLTCWKPGRWFWPACILCSAGVLRSEVNDFGFEEGFRLMEVVGCPVDSKAAAKFLFDAAVDGDPAAANNLGVAYAQGVGIAKNREAANRWLMIAAEKANSAIPELNLSHLHEEGAAHSSPSIYWLKKAAQRKDPTALLLLGLLMDGGLLGVDRDKEGGQLLIEQAADAGSGAAKLMFAMILLKAERPDTARAMKLMQRAAEQGVVFAQVALAERYQKGEDVEQDSSRAVIWFRRAAESGSVLGMLAMAEYFEKVEKDPAKAFPLYLATAEKGHEMAISMVGRAYALGTGVKQDKKEALRWLKKRKDNYLDFSIIASSFAGGTDVEKDSAKAMEWLETAADLGYPMAYFALGNHYKNGDWVRRDLGQAVAWKIKAARAGFSSECFAIAEIYLNGVGVGKDEVEALAWYYAAGAAGNSIAASYQHELEQRLGRDLSILAQQRSKDLLGATAPDVNPPNGEGGRGGSGVIITSDGYILTAAHVVASARSITVVRASTRYPAWIVALDSSNDVALLKVETSGLPAARVGSSAGVRLGQTVATVGFPQVNLQGVSPKATRGEVTSLKGASDDPRMWQISVPVQMGNSGGALFDATGSVVGIIVQKLGLKAAALTGDLPQNVNYALKISYAMPLLGPISGSFSTVSAVRPSRAFEDMIAEAEKSAVMILAQ
jgi:uncharacterized protein